MNNPFLWAGVLAAVLVYVNRARVASFLGGQALNAVVPAAVQEVETVAAAALPTFESAFASAIALAEAEVKKIQASALAKEIGSIAVNRLTPIPSALPAVAPVHPAAALATAPAPGSTPANPKP